jgi:EAL domain-containing protein (putative c-di-GMP-specific phosphodiesterase class I)/GGDEF domain-containing protein
MRAPVETPLRSPSGLRRAVLLLAPDSEVAMMIRIAGAAGTLPVAVRSDADAASAAAAERLAAVILADARAGASVTALSAVPDAPPVVALLPDRDAVTACDMLAADVRGLALLDDAPEELRRVVASVVAGEPAVSSSLGTPVILTLLERSPAPPIDPVAARDHVRERFAELRAVFQPIADLSSLSRLGFLALTRCAGGDADDLFAEARELGIGVEYELAATRAVLSQLDRLPGGDVLFIKLSCAAVAHEELPALLAPGTEPRIVLELSGRDDDDEGFYPAIDRLRARGMRFAVDETGAAFGSLDYLLDLAPAFVRLPSGLTRGIHSDRTRRALALAVTSFATHLGTRVIADQIESEAELAALRRLGVSYGIGAPIGGPGDLPQQAPEAPPELGDAGPSETIAWAAPGAEFDIPRRARRAFDVVTQAVLRALADRLDRCTVYVAYHDRPADALRLADVIADELPMIETGRIFTLSQSIDGAVLDGRAPQWTADARACEDEGARAMAAALNGPGWACVPFAGTRDAAFATLTAVGRGLGPDTLELLRAAGALLSEVLQAEPDDPERTLREQSWRDRSTGVLNAARFHELLDAAGDEACFVAAVSLTNFDTIALRMGQAVADLVRKDTARALAFQAEMGDVIARVGATTFGCLLYGRRAGEVDYFLDAVADQVAAAAARRGATAELRLGAKRLGLGATNADAWQAAQEQAFSTS